MRRATAVTYECVGGFYEHFIERKHRDLTLIFFALRLEWSEKSKTCCKQTFSFPPQKIYICSAEGKCENYARKLQILPFLSSKMI